MADYSQLPEVIHGRVDNVEPRIRIISYRTVGKYTAILDYVLITISCFAAGYCYEFIFLHVIANFKTYFGIGNVSAIIFLLLSYGLYKPKDLISLKNQIRGILFNWIVTVLLLSLILFLLKIGASNSRGALLVFAFVGLCLLVASRVVICTKLSDALARGTLAGYAAVVIGDREALKGLSGLHILQRFGAREIGRFELRAADGEQVNLALIDQAIEAARAKDAESVLLALQWGDVNRRKFVCERLQALPLPVLLLPDQSISPLLSQPLRQLGSDFAVEIQREPLSPPELALKRTLDLLLGGVALVGLAPLLAVVSLLIKLDSRGPVIFRQRRKGFNGREFAIYKFRTMGVLEDGDVISQAKRNDVRITRVGRILRATSIDELPQLINVLRGQMSLVGPRPHPVALDNGYAELIANYAFRQHVKPGITGWAQVHGLRGETSQLELMKQRVALDLWYIKNWDLLLDLKIIMLTCFELVRGQNAY
jgi:Undecaprenyl-phosphate glucose phosphotransferase